MASGESMDPLRWNISRPGGHNPYANAKWNYKSLIKLSPTMQYKNILVGCPMTETYRLQTSTVIMHPHHTLPLKGNS